METKDIRVLRTKNAIKETVKQMSQLDHICVYDTNRIFFTFFSSQETYVEKMLCDLSYNNYIIPLLKQSLKKNRETYNPFPHYSKEMLNIIDLFIIEGTLLVYRQWIKDQKVIPLENVIELTSHLLENGIASLREK